MGIKNLHPFLRKTCPFIYSDISLSEFAFEKIAIDTSIFLCKFKTTSGSNWKEAFFQFVIRLRALDVHPVFVFDTVFPVEKDLEKQNRIDARNKIRERTARIAMAWKEVTQDKVAESITIDLSHERWRENLDFADFLKKVAERSRQHALVDGTTVFQFAVADVCKEIEKLQNACFVLRTEDFLWTKKLLDVLRVPYVPAVGEAEATCAVLNRHGLVKAVLSEDTDVLAYGAPVFLHRINVADLTVSQIHCDTMLRALELMAPQFLDFCIMCGTDYNTNIPRIGPDKSYRFIQKFGTIENMLARCEQLDGTPLKYQRVRQLFDTSFDISHLHVPYCDVPDLVEIRDFCVAHQLPFDENGLREALYTSPSIQYPPGWQHPNMAVRPVSSLLTT